MSSVRRVVGTVVLLARGAALAVTVARLVGPLPANLASGRSRTPGVRKRADVVSPGAGVSVVIPARDEAGRIGPCLEAVGRMAGVTEVVVVDDQSTDPTARIAERAGARVVAGQPLPAGWAGKAWALQQGIEAAAGPVVITLDADARPGSGLVPVLVDRLVAGADFLTVAGRFDCPTAGSRALHPALLTTLVYRFGRPGGTDATGRDGDRQLANGQCMAFVRETFLAEGGMSGVRGELVEDVALARRLTRQGRRVEFVDAPEHLTVRMFESFADTWTGWGRSIALPGVEPRRRQLTDLARLTVVQGLPLVRLVLGRADVVDGVALAVRAGTLVGTRRAYERPGVAYWCSVLLDPAAVLRLAGSIARPSRSWRGRTYPG